MESSISGDGPRRLGRPDRVWIVVAVCTALAIGLGGWYAWSRSHSIVGVWRAELVAGTEVIVRLDPGGKAYGRLIVLGREVGDTAAGSWEMAGDTFSLRLDHSVPFVSKEFRCRVVQHASDTLTVSVDGKSPAAWRLQPDEALPRPADRVGGN